MPLQKGGKSQMEYCKLNKEEKIEFWKRHKKEFEKSNLKAKEYCEREKINFYSFRDWRKKVDKIKGKRLVEIPINIENAKERSEFELIINDSIKIKIPIDFDSNTLAKLLTSLGVKQ